MAKNLELVTKDNKSENAEASTSSTNLAIQSNVNAIVGPATSGAVAAASLVSQKTGVPLLTPSGTQDDLTVDANGAKKFVSVQPLKIATKVKFWQLILTII